ncbi:putative DNA mismatch repair protein [Rhizoctonia solani 123E]|uniref:Putative DNA mismatch repair protein n=1 Tax=Rhizoctonia solani 123E TaxID=1423351 RepID=A0A074SWT8_9AGAM|nr:putative DNA mismatch repair protein [Rhizoctonia solani 123E]
MSLFISEPITELEPQTKAKLRSTQILTSLPQLISELVQNSLDAGASHIEVGMDPAEWECWVRDDGQGMSTEGMRLLTQGHEKGRYNSSKSYEASQTEAGTFGFRGEALASAMELSCLEISSRTPNARESWSVILKGGEQLYLGPSVRWRRERAGTTAVCRDVFFNVPVRRKSHPNVARTLELTRKELENLALVFPQVSITLDHTNELQKSRVLSVSKTGSSLAAFRALYGKAMAESVEELNIRSEDLAIEGFISLNGSHSRGFQNFYINRHPMVFGEIQRAIEQMFAASGFGRMAHGGDEYDSNLPPRTLRSPKKTDRKPVYVLNLGVSSAQVDNFLEPAKSMVRFQDTNRVLSFVLEVIHRFLSRNGFATATSRLTGTEAVQTEQSSRPSRKRVRRETIEPDSSDAQLALKASSNTQGLTKLSESYRDRRTGDDDTCIEHGDSGYFEWADPSTGESFSIDSQTGNSLPQHRSLDQTQTNRSEADNDSSELSSTSRLDRSWLKKNGPSASGSNEEVPTWLADALKRNDTFAFPEKGVFSTKTTSSNTPLGHRPTPRAHTGVLLENHWASSLTQCSQPTSKTFSRQDLHNSEVIAQVDTKFIACVFRITAASERILVLVDQHAADERVRVERYLKRLCIGFIQDKVDVFRFDSPIKILLARREAEILARPDLLNALSRWGLCIDIRVPSAFDGRNLTEGQDFCQGEVLFVPDVVSKRLVDKRELSEFVKAMATTIDAEGCSHWPPPSASGAEDGYWVKALRFCPLPLFELVNSRACRGAIMFNDPLDRPQCQRLIMQLGETVFPFQCAHGRPSIAPLLRLDNVPPITHINWRAFDQEP